MTRDQALLGFLSDRLADSDAPDQLAEVTRGADAGDGQLRVALVGARVRPIRRAGNPDAPARAYLALEAISSERGIPPMPARRCSDRYEPVSIDLKTPVNPRTSRERTYLHFANVVDGNALLARSCGAGWSVATSWSDGLVRCGRKSW